MLADALDGTLSAADQEFFDLHMAHCGPCAQLLADAQRGAAWLEMLKTPRPEPPATLVEKILAQTSGAYAVSSAGQVNLPVPAPVSGYMGAGVPAYSNVVPFRVRAVTAIRSSAFGQIMFQPRLAMTAAMAFFSIALTLNLTGIRVQDVRLSDLKPSSLKRGYTSGKVRVMQYYDNLRVVYELESRVHDLQGATDNDATSGSQQPSTAQPDRQTPSTDPDNKDGKRPAAQPQQKQRPGEPGGSGPVTGPTLRPAPNSGTSQRESLNRNFRLVAATDTGLPTIGTDGTRTSVVVTSCFAAVVVCDNERVKVKGRLV
jgi:hypothetical protein